MQARIKDLTTKGTGFFISGSYVATDLWDNPNSAKETAAADRDFAKSVLGYAWRESRAAVEGGAYRYPPNSKPSAKAITHSTSSSVQNAMQLNRPTE